MTPGRLRLPLFVGGPTSSELPMSSAGGSDEDEITGRTGRVPSPVTFLATHAAQLWLAE